MPYRAMALLQLHLSVFAHLLFLARLSHPSNGALHGNCNYSNSSQTLGSLTNGRRSATRIAAGQSAGAKCQSRGRCLFTRCSNVTGSRIGLEYGRTPPTGHARTHSCRNNTTCRTGKGTEGWLFNSTAIMSILRTALAITLLHQAQAPSQFL